MAMMRTILSTMLALALISVAVPSAAADAPVADAARRGDIDAVRALLADGSDVDAPLGDGMTALHWASHRGDETLVDLLLEAGASTAAVTRLGQHTPLHVASRAARGAVVHALVAREWQKARLVVAARCSGGTGAANRSRSFAV